MRAQQLSRLGRVDRRSWLGRARDALDALVKSSPSRFAILIFASLIVLSSPCCSRCRSRERRPPGHPARRRPVHGRVGRSASPVSTTVDMATYWSPFGNALDLHRREHRRHRRADARVDPGSRDLASARTASEAHRRERHESVAHPRRPGGRTAGGAPRRGRRAARHGRDQRAGHRVTVAVSTLTIEAVIAWGWSRACSSQATTSARASGTRPTTRRGPSRTPDSAPNAAGLAPFVDDYWFQSLMMIGVFLGSVGFPVIFALSQAVADAAPVERAREAHPGDHGHPLRARCASISCCSSTTTRRPTAQFGVGHDPLRVVLHVDDDAVWRLLHDRHAELNGSSLLVSDMLMFIGGGSASTAGGIKVTTLAVLFLAAFAEARGAPSMEAFGRRIPRDMLRLAGERRAVGRDDRGRRVDRPAADHEGSRSTSCCST